MRILHFTEMRDKAPLMKTMPVIFKEDQLIGGYSDLIDSFKMNNFIFYDTETSGVKELDFIQVIQFVAIQTNDNFIKTNSFNEFCSPLPWTLISPKALLVNKKSEIFNTEKTHYEP